MNINISEETKINKNIGKKSKCPGEKLKIPAKSYKWGKKSKLITLNFICWSNNLFLTK